MPWQSGATGIRKIGNRPLVAKIGSVAFLTGRTKAPSWNESLNDTARHLALEVRDRSYAMELCKIKSPVPLDGSNISSALAYFAQMPGYSSGDMDIQSISYPLPSSGQTSGGNYALLPEDGDTAMMWMQKLWETFLRNYSWGWVPRVAGPIFRFHDIPTLNAQSVAATLYSTVAAAVTAGATAAQIPSWVFRSYHEQTVLCEANEIRVKGMNPKTQKPIYTVYQDTASQDPTLIPSARPDNWVGEPWLYAWIDPALTTLYDGFWACAQLAARLTPKRTFGEWTSDFLLFANGQPVWRNDLVRLVGIGTFRVMHLEGDFKSEHAKPTSTDPYPDFIWRPFTYAGELIPGTEES